MEKINKNMVHQTLAWVVRLRSETVGEADLAGFAEWVSAPDNHQQAWGNAMETWETLGVVFYFLVDQLLVADTEPKHNNLWLSKFLASFRSH